MESDVFDSKNGKVIFVCINQSYEKLIDGKIVKGRENAYECVRKYWPIKDVEKANEADFILGCREMKIVAVCKKDARGWRKISEDSELKEEFKNDDEMKTNFRYWSRYAFSGELIEESSRFGKGSAFAKRKTPYLDLEMPEEYRFNVGKLVLYNY